MKSDDVVGCSILMVIIFLIFTMSIDWDSFMCHLRYMGESQHRQCFKVLQ